MYRKRLLPIAGAKVQKKLSTSLRGLRVFVVDTRIELVLHA